MIVRDIMTPYPSCCEENSSLTEVAKMMVDHNCGEIPVVDAENRPIGVITDRDIVCRVIARGENPLRKKVRDCMSVPCITVTTHASIAECCDVLEKNQIRRVPVIDEYGACCGIVSLADIATHNLKGELVEVMEMVSQTDNYVT